MHTRIGQVRAADVSPAASVPGAVLVRVRQSKTNQDGSSTDVRMVKNGPAVALRDQGRAVLRFRRRHLGGQLPQLAVLFVGAGVGVEQDVDRLSGFRLAHLDLVSRSA